MSDPFSLADHLRQAFASPVNGVVGLVDELLAVAREQNVWIGWANEKCQVFLRSYYPAFAFEVPVPKSAFRAVLARVATLCNQCAPNSVTPYGGVGSVQIPGTAETLHVRFMNTPDKQSLELSPVELEPDRSIDGNSVPVVAGRNGHAAPANAPTSVEQDR